MKKKKKKLYFQYNEMKMQGLDKQLLRQTLLQAQRDKPSMIKIWIRGQILAQKSTFLELPQNERERSPLHHEPNATRFVSGKLMATCRRGHAWMSHDPFSEFY
jgi:hypothetical protein